MQKLAKHLLVSVASLLSLLLTTVIYRFSTEETQITHPLWKTMLHGHAGSRGWDFILLGWLEGIAFLFCVHLFFRIALGRSRGKLLSWLTFMSWMHVFMWTALVLCYRFEAAELWQFFWGLPPSSLLLVFAVWPFPILLMLVYYVHFATLIYSKKDAKKFRRLLTQKKNDQYGRP